jgi:sec-independent protein translocase protein TatA
MGTFSIWHWLIVLVVVLVLFGGGGKIKKIMGDMGSGVTAFKKGLKDEGKPESPDETKAIPEEKATPDQAGETATEEDKDKVASG